MQIEFQERDEAEGVVAIIGTHTLPDGRKAACMDRVHGKYRTMPAPYLFVWVKCDRYDELMESARQKIRQTLTNLIAKQDTMTGGSGEG